MFRQSYKSLRRWDDAYVFYTSMDIFGPHLDRLLELLVSLFSRGRKTRSERRPTAPLRGCMCVSTGGGSLLALAAFSSPLLIQHPDLARYRPRRKSFLLRKEDPQRQRQTREKCSRMIQHHVLLLYWIVPCCYSCVTEQKPLTQTSPSILHTPHLSHAP